MFDLDFIVTFALMGLLFIRQAVIFKQPNKINYAPLLLGIGAIGSMVHLLINPENEDFILLFRESILPIFAGLMLFVIMNILHQAQQRQLRQTQQKFTEKLMEQVTQMKEYIGKLEDNQQVMKQQEASTQEQMRLIFHEEIQALDAIALNQKHFIAKIEDILQHQENALKNFETFTQKEMPDLDNVIHRHIDMLRIAEQDHFNQIKKAVQNSLEGSSGVDRELAAMRESIDAHALVYKEAAQQMVVQSGAQLEKIFRDFAHQLSSLRSQSEGITTVLHEDENVLEGIREQSELVMKQMILSAKQMDGILSDSQRVRDVYAPLSGLVHEVSKLHSDYVGAKMKLDSLSDALNNAEGAQIEHMRRQVEELIEKIDARIEHSLNSMREHFHIAEKDISTTVQQLSSKAKMRQSYQSDS